MASTISADEDTKQYYMDMDTKSSELEQLLEISSPTRENIHQIFSPYRRISPPWNLYERLKTTFVLLFIFPFRLLYFLLSGSILILIAYLALLAIPKSTEQQQQSTPKQHQNKTESPTASHNSNDTSMVTPDFDETSLPSQKQYDEMPLFKPLSLWRRFLISLSFPLVRSILFVCFGIFHIKREKASFSPHVKQHHTSVENNGNKTTSSTSTPPSNSASSISPSSTSSSTSSPSAYVIVANHLGYIDILILMHTYRGSFVAKGDCETFPIIGLLARALQCMFVRPGHSLTSELINRVRSTHACHEHRKTCGNCPTCMTSLVIFAEGTTTNGSSMIPFRTGIFNAGVPVKPVCIQFPYRRFNLSWETIRFREHLFRSMTQITNYVHCTEFPVYVRNNKEIEDSRLFASNVQREMANVMKLNIFPLNRKHKLLYHSYLIGKIKSEAEVVEKAKKLLHEDKQLDYYISSSRQSSV